MSDNAKLVELLREGGPGVFSPEVQAEVDRLLESGEPLPVEYRMRLIATVGKTLSARDEEKRREWLERVGRVGILVADAWRRNASQRELAQRLDALVAEVWPVAGAAQETSADDE